MSTLEATISMLETMPQEAQEKVFQYTKTLFTSFRPSNPYTLVSIDQILADLDESHNQIIDGKGIPMAEALQNMGARHGFI